MSNPNEYLEDDDNEESKPVKLRDHEKAQAKRIKELEANEAKAAEAIKKLAFLEAGVDINSPAAKWFVKGYDGEFTSDAIKVAAVEAKLIADPSNDPAVEAERAAAVRVAEAGRVNEGAVIPADFASRVAAAKTPAELEQIMALENAGKTP